MYYDRVKAYFYRDSGTTQIMLGFCMLSMPGLYRFAFDLCQTGKENEGFRTKTKAHKNNALRVR
jgi:hypothetical protein